MSTYSETIAIFAGASRASITDWTAQLVDTSGADVGSAITDGFANLGAGNYSWTASLDSAFQGSAIFVSAAAGIRLSSAINPPSPSGAVDAEALAEAVDTRLSDQHGGGSWIGGVVAAATTVTVTQRPRYSTAGGDIRNIRHTQLSSVTYGFDVVDDAGNAIDMSGKTLRALIYDTNNVASVVIDNGPKLSAVGNRISRTIDQDDAADAADLLWILRNLTDGNVPIVQGQFIIPPAPLELPPG